MSNSVDDYALASQKADQENLSADYRQKMVYYLRVKLPEDFKAELVLRIKKYPGTWNVESDGSFMPFHFTQGMAIRNLLRSGGFSEKIIGIENLDNVYAGIIEEAVSGI